MLGAGTGKNSLHLARMGWQVEAFDFSRLAIDLARRKLIGTSVSVSCEDLRYRRYSEGHYNSIILYGVAHCLTDNELCNFAAAARRSLKKGGCLLIASFTPEIPPPASHFHREVYLRTSQELINAFGSCEVAFCEMGEILESHGNLVAEHRHSMCWLALRFP